MIFSNILYSNKEQVVKLQTLILGFNGDILLPINKLHDNNSEIIFLLNDRSETDLSKSIGLITMSEKSNNNLNADDVESFLNLKVIPTYNCSSTHDILKLVKSYTDCVQRANTNLSSINTIANKNILTKKRILLIYSLSELLIFYGLYHTQSLLSQLEATCGCQHIIMVLHESYH